MRNTRNRSIRKAVTRPRKFKTYSVVRAKENKGDERKEKRKEKGEMENVRHINRGNRK